MSMSVGKFLLLINFGISEIVLRFSVITSPSAPSPLDSPVTNLLFL